MMGLYLYICPPDNGMTEYRISIKLIKDKEKADIRGLVVSVEFSGINA